MQTTDLCFLAKKQTINSWCWAQITTCLGCCGRGSWPEIAGLSVPWVFNDIEALVANMKQGISGNASHMVSHTLINPERSQIVSGIMFSIIKLAISIKNKHRLISGLCNTWTFARMVENTVQFPRCGLYWPASFKHWKEGVASDTFCKLSCVHGFSQPAHIAFIKLWC